MVFVDGKSFCCSTINHILQYEQVDYFEFMYKQSPIKYTGKFLPLIVVVIMCKRCETLIH